MPKLIEINKDSGLIVRNKSQVESEIVIYGDIGGFGEDSINASQFKKALDSLPTSVKQLTLRVNSPGGDVFDGFAIYNLLQQHKAKITTYVDGVALSIASIIIQASDKIIMGEGSYIMIHKPWTIAMGNSIELESTIDRLLDIEEKLVFVYAKRIKKSRQEIKDAMRETTWYDSKQAVEVGLADEAIEESYSIAASYKSTLPWAKDTKTMINHKAVKDRVRDFLKTI